MFTAIAVSLPLPSGLFFPVFVVGKLRTRSLWRTFCSFLSFLSRLSLSLTPLLLTPHFRPLLPPLPLTPTSTPPHSSLHSHSLLPHSPSLLPPLQLTPPSTSGHSSLHPPFLLIPSLHSLLTQFLLTSTLLIPPPHPVTPSSHFPPSTSYYSSPFPSSYRCSLWPADRGADGRVVPHWYIW